MVATVASDKRPLDCSVRWLNHVAGLLESELLHSGASNSNGLLMIHGCRFGVCTAAQLQRGMKEGRNSRYE